MPLIDPSGGNNLTSYNALLTTTLQNFRNQLVDNFSDATPTMWWLTSNGRKRTYSGGQSIEVPLMYGATQVQPFSGYDNLLTEPAEGIAPATFLAKKYQVPIVISRDHETDNMGESAIINLLEAKVKQAEISFKEELNRDMINNGYAGPTSGVGTVAPDPMRITGFFDFLQDAAGTRPYGGIANTNTWWQNQVIDIQTPSAPATEAALQAALIENMRTLYLNCSRGSDAPDLVLCDQATYELYEETLVSDKRFVNTNAADAGFESLMYRATTILFDRDMPANTLVMLNSNYITLYVHSDVDMASTPFREAENQWARFSRILWKGELTCSNRARQGLMTRIST